MAGFRIEGNTSNHVAEVDVTGNLYVTLPDGSTARGGAAAVGSIRIFSENDPGTISGTPYLYSPETSDDFKLRVGIDHLQDNEIFCYASQHTGKFTHTFVTLTALQTANSLVTNSGSITTLNTGMKFNTFRYFPVFGGQTPLYVEAMLSLTAALTTNTTIDVGLFLPGAANPYVPLDGVYFRFTSAGVQGVVNYNGTETATAVFKAVFGGANYDPGINAVHQITITINQREVGFWIDDVKYAELTAQSGNGSPFAAWNLPFALRHAIGGTAAAAALSLKVWSYSVFTGDIAMDKPWAEQLAGAGQAHQGQSGQTMGSVASYANSANPTSAAGSNTATNITGLGGQGAINAAASAATDFIACSYQNPAGTVASPGKTLFIKGVWVSCFNAGAAVLTTPTTLGWSLAYGHTAISMAQAETATFATATTKAPRRIPLGFMSAAVGTAIGGMYAPDRIYVQFAAPVPVLPGEWVALAVKQIIGTVTGSQSIWYSIGFDHYWE